jgi:hypothetical protein
MDISYLKDNLHHFIGFWYNFGIKFIEGMNENIHDK